VAVVLAAVVAAVAAAVVVTRLRLAVPVMPAVVVAGLNLTVPDVAGCVVGTMPLVRRTVIGTVPLMLAPPVGVAVTTAVVPRLRFAVPDVVRAIIDADGRRAACRWVVGRGGCRPDSERGRGDQSSGRGEDGETLHEVLLGVGPAWLS
jgi:hypothetical protein